MLVYDRIRSLELHRRARGKVKIFPTISVNNEEDAFLASYPGSVAPGTRLEAVETKAIVLPSPDSTGLVLSPFSGPAGVLTLRTAVLRSGLARSHTNTWLVAKPPGCGPLPHSGRARAETASEV